MADPILLIGDIGGTNARFALADPARPGYSNVVKMACSEFATADLAIEHYLETSSSPPPTVVCLAAAGPIVDGSVRFTNNHWQISVDRLMGRLGAKGARLLNDFEAIAYSLPFLGSEDTTPIGLLAARKIKGRDFSAAVLGPGTGLGVAGLIGRDGEVYPVVGEGGHRGFAPETHKQIEVLSLLRERFERVSNERLISGPGLKNIDWAMRRLHDQPGPQRSAEEVFVQSAQGEEIAMASLRLFFHALGQVAGDLALELSARDGVYIAGGIVKRYPEVLKASGFRASFEQKGRHRSLMEQIPTLLITHPDPGLLGAAYGALELVNRLGRKRWRS